MSPCPHTDAILAVLLDGDRAPEGLRPDRHVEECGVCQDALRRARRLDALLATQSPVFIEDALADRLLNDATPQPQPSAEHRNQRPRLLLAAAAIAICGIGLGGVGSWWAFGGSPDAPPDAMASGTTEAPSPPVRTRQDTADDAPPPDALTMVFPDAPARTKRNPSARRPLPIRPALEPAEVLRQTSPWSGYTAAGTAAILRVVANPWAPTVPTWQGFAAEARAITRAARFRAGVRLLASRADQDRVDLFAFLAEHEGPVATDLVAAARREAPAVRWLQRRVERPRGPAALDRQLLITASRIGGRSLDRTLLRRVRREPQAAAEIAAGLAMATRNRNGGVELLLDVHDNLRSREHELADRMPQWFAALPDATTDALIHLIRTARQQAQRQAGLLALSWRRDPRALSFLLGRVGDKNLDTALGAGHALSRLRPSDAAVSLHDALADSRRPYVLLAALFGMRSPLARAAIRSDQLTREEADFLRGGRFTREQFTIAARLCRRRHLLTD